MNAVADNFMGLAVVVCALGWAIAKIIRAFKGTDQDAQFEFELGKDKNKYEDA